MQNDTLDKAFGAAIAAAMKDNDRVAHVFVAVVDHDGVVGSGSTLDEVHQIDLLSRMVEVLKDNPRVESLWVNRKTGEMRDHDPDKKAN